MSKAFTRESDDAEDLPVVRQPLPPGVRNYITREGADRLQQRMTGLLEKKEAVAGSDSEKREVEAAIRTLRQILDSVVVAEIPADREKVAFGAKVTIRRSNGEEESYRIVGVDETDLENGAISWLSPLARALMSKRAGDKVRFRAPAGEEDLMIRSVGY